MCIVLFCFVVFVVVLCCVCCIVCEECLPELDLELDLDGARIGLRWHDYTLIQPTPNAHTQHPHLTR